MDRMIIKNGTVVNASGTANADVCVEDGVITAVGAVLNTERARVIDASGCCVFPGFIDTHTHFDLDLGVTITADDFNTGTRAAILGGTTCVLDFATQDKGGTLSDALALWHRKARGSSSNYGFHMAIADWNESVLREMDYMSESGVTSYKMYMVYDALKVDDGQIYSALKAAKQKNALIGLHCENWDIIGRRIAELKAAGVTGPIGHPLSRPAAVEAEAVARYMRIAELAEAPAYVVHLSTAEGLVEARRARARSQEVYLETCPQYLLLDDARYKDDDGEKFIMSPPLRTPADNEALWNALGNNEIDTIGTDHCSFTMAQKALGGGNFFATPNGGAGVGYRAQLIYTYGVLRNRITLAQMAALLSYNASRLFGMRGRGEIVPGAAADIVVWDASYNGRITNGDGVHNCDNSTFNGFDVAGRARDVILNGEHVVENGSLVLPNRGKYIAREGYNLI